jgi:hypothetical protein
MCRRSPSRSWSRDRRDRSPSPPRYSDVQRSRERPTRSSYRERSPLPRYSRATERPRSPARGEESFRLLNSRRNPSPRGRTLLPRDSNRGPVLAAQLTDPITAGRMAAQAVWDAPS